MLIYSLFLSAFLIGVHSNGEFSVLNYPKSISFKGHDHLKESTIKEVFFATLGFTNSQFSNWKGLYINDPFNLAEGIATVVVEGMPSIDQPKGHHFPLKTDTEDDSIFSTVKDGINLRYPQELSQIVHIDLANNLEDQGDNNLFKDIKIEKPKKNKLLKNEAENREFLKDIDLLNAIAEKVPSHVRSDGVPDLFWFKLTSLHPIVDLYGENSTEVKEAKKLLNEVLLRLNDAFKKAYNGAVIFSVITSDVSHTRKTRSILADKERDLNLASDYSEDYPVIFNIVLWLCVVLGFSLLAISLVIGNMDPGRDSIIYRMTNPRMKKDN